MPRRILTYRFHSQIYSGVGALEELPGIILELKTRRCGIFTDSGLADSPAFALVMEILGRMGTEIPIFTGVEVEPSIDSIGTGAAFVREYNLDCLIGVGGGSVLDSTKAASWYSLVGGEPSSYLGTDLVPSPGIPMILVPTTAGTGSEVTPAAIFYNPRTGIKEAIFSRFHFCHAAVLDPRMLLSVPPDTTAATGMDALIHALECFLSVRATVMTDALALGSVKIIFENLPAAYSENDNVEARMKMQEACMMSAISFGHAGVAAIHALSYAFGGVFKVPHGLANSIMMMPVLRFTFPHAISRLARLCRAIGADDPDAPDEQNAEVFLDALDALYTRVRLPRRLRYAGVPEDAIPAMAVRTMQVKRLLDNHPCPLTAEDAERIFRSAY